MVRAVCPGSFDPVTRGHLDVVERSAALFDQVVVAVGVNPAKPGLFTPPERLEMVQEACRYWPGVSVALFSGLLVDFCRAQGITVIAKGVRAPDFDFELSMAQMNRTLTGVETVLIPSSPQWSFVSSSLVRDIATHGGDVAGFLTPEVARRTTERAQLGRA